ncbi:hypothetical protein U5S90_04540 [Streptococcus agalactiae]|uniref:hypothetical protein n=1 Tax=Streptococcus agalactiae TaxID=1311 RepID=UPI00137500B9|nr:hypothetical protein [Streptococcus agalactiae]KAF1128142.1 hypothetical protein B8U92_02975 [Streptococcus agalactiae]MCD0020570.1 hypothetical protein [Streptococcus agalactiae]HEN9895404.1 hypothetical protein [Streptococcus agalactiae]
MQELNLTPSQTVIFFIISTVILLVMILSKQTLDFVQDFNKACDDNEKACADLIKASEELKQTIVASRQGAYLQIEHH